MKYLSALDSKISTHLNRILAFAVLLFSMSILGSFLLNSSTHATSINDFKAGNIISDSVFYNKDTMNVQQIQTFLDRQIGSCDTWGTGRATEWGSNLSRADFARSQGWHSPPYVCLNNYHENPNNKENSYTRGGGYFPGSISAAQIIYNASQQYNINPQVLLTMLRKESAGPLTNDRWPLQSQYTYAMGWGCPDSGPGYSANCKGARAGFYSQIMTAAWQFNYYKENSNSYRYKLGWNNIQYAPDPTCGTKRVNIENVATLSLYIYTPYTPNNASLRNHPGEAHCGSYGNRNFFMMFSGWFGSTQKDLFAPMDVGRKLVSNKVTHKINPSTGENISNQIIQNEQVVEYNSKVENTPSGLCLRTKSNTDTNAQMCVPYRDLEEGPEFKSITPIKLVSKSNTPKIDPIDNKSIPKQTIPKGLVVEFTSSAVSRISGEECLRTKANTNTGYIGCVPKSKLETPAKFNSIDNTTLVASRTTYKIDPYTEHQIPNQIVPAGMAVRYDSKTTTLKSGIECVRTEANTQTNATMCIPLSHLHDYTDPKFTGMDVPRSLTTNKKTIKIDPVSGRKVEDLPKDLKIDFSQKTYFNGNLCLRTSTDKILNKITCVIYDNLKE